MGSESTADAPAFPACGLVGRETASRAYAGRVKRLVLVFLLAACGGRSSLLVDEAAASVTPTSLYTKDDRGCPSLQPLGDAPKQLAIAQAGEGVAVVEVFFQEECTGAGGQYILAREVDGDRAFWIGAHACWTLDRLPPGRHFGVLRYSQTAALFRIDDHLCVGFPERPPGATSDAHVRAVALFSTLSDARAYAAALR